MPVSNAQDRKITPTLLVFVAVVIAITLFASRLLALSAISPLSAAAMVVYVVAAGWGMHAARHDPSAWSLPGFWVSFGLCGILMFLQLAVGFVVVVLGGDLALVLPAVVCATLVFSVGVGLVSLKKSFFSTMFPVPIWWVHLNIAVLLGIPIAILNIGIAQYLVRWIPVDPALELLEQIILDQPLDWVIFVVCLLPAIGEEVLFRGLIGRGLVVRYGQMAGVLITSLLFAMIHLNALQGVIAFMIGIILHLVYQWTGSLWAPIALHFVNNATAVICSRLMQPASQSIAQRSDEEWSVSWLLALVAFEAAAGLLLAIATSRRRFESPPECKPLHSEPPSDEAPAADDNLIDAPHVSVDPTTEKVLVIKGDATASRQMLVYWLVGLVGLTTMLVMLFQSYFEQPFQ